VCCTYTNSFGTLKKEDYSSVYVDDREEAFRAVSTLMEKGHRKIAILLDSVHDRSISELRYQGYCNALKAGGIDVDPDLVEEIGGYEMVDAYEGMKRLLDRRNDFTAVFAIGDALAVAAMKAMHDRGRRVPEDCSFIAIDGIDMSVYSIPTLTTLVQPKEQLGKEAVRILLDMIEKRGGNRHIKLTTTLRFGGSVRNCP
jgi:LacI family transcriptional regulator